MTNCGKDPIKLIATKMMHAVGVGGSENKLTNESRECVDIQTYVLPTFEHTAKETTVQAQVVPRYS